MPESSFADKLRAEARYGSEFDVPEGTRIVRLSDTLALALADYLDRLAREQACDTRTAQGLHCPEPPAWQVRLDDDRLIYVCARCAETARRLWPQAQFTDLTAAQSSA
jgi:hypothetical protein